MTRLTNQSGFAALKNPPDLSVSSRTLKSGSPEEEYSEEPPLYNNLWGRNSPEGSYKTPALTPPNILTLQRTLGNRKVSQLIHQARFGSANVPMPGSIPTTPSQVIQRVATEGRVITGETKLYKTRSPKTPLATLKEGTACTEMPGSTPKWIKVKVISSKMVGWVLNEATRTQPNLADPEDDDDSTVNQYLPLTQFQGPGKKLSLFGEEGPSSDDISQGGLGDCWFLAPLASISETPKGKELIKAMITPHRMTSKYKVRFFVPTGEKSDEVKLEEIEVDNLFPAYLNDGEDEVGGSDSEGSDSEKGSKSEESSVQKEAKPPATPAYSKIPPTLAIWPLIVEKAFAELKGGFNKISGGMVSNAYLALTGKRPEIYAKEKNEDQFEDSPEGIKPLALQDKLVNAVKNNQPVSVHLPPKEKEATLTFNKPKEEVGELEFGALVPDIHFHAFSMTYQGAEGPITIKKEKQNKGKLEFLEFDNALQTIITIKPKGNEIPKGDSFQAQAKYSTNLLSGDAEEGLSGGHVYMMYNYVADNAPGKGKVTLVDPRKTSDTIELTVKEIVLDYKGKFYIGDSDLPTGF